MHVPHRRKRNERQHPQKSLHSLYHTSRRGGWSCARTLGRGSSDVCDHSRSLLLRRDADYGLDVLMKYVGLVMLVLALAACGGGTHPKSSPINAPDYHLEYVPLNGKTLVCLVKQVKQRQESWGGISCDWGKFDERNR